ncbi:MAG: hypothetical protein IPN89_07655 [Saprospiraceae bacterium]|nr:hypothetical protein [Saprospiraceae bacterium]
MTGSSKIGISIGQSFNDVSPLPSDLTEAKIILKEESNRLPLGAGWPDWIEDYNWPKVRLEEQPNRYFRFNVGIHYIFTKRYKKDHNFTIGLGAIISHRDEGELMKMVETSKLIGLFFRPTDDHSIPIFSYNTYLDAGIKSDFTYVFKKFNFIHLGFRSSFILFPKSGDVMINNGLVISIFP